MYYSMIMLPQIRTASRTLLRALAPRPSLPYSLAHNRSRTIRTKHTQADKSTKNVPPPPIDQAETRLASDRVERLGRKGSSLDAHQSSHIPDKQIQKEIDSGRLPVINWYEQGPDTAEAPRLVDRIANVEDWKRELEMHDMTVQSTKDPNFDDTTLNRRLIDLLLADPDFADLTEELKEMKEGIKTKEELEAEEKQAAKEAELESQQFNVSLQMEVHQAIQQLINDPEFVDAKPELQAVLDKMPELDELDKPEYQDVLDQAMAKISSNPAMEKKLDVLLAQAEGDASDKEWENFERDMQEVVEEEDDKDIAVATEDLGDLDKLILQMRDVMKSAGIDDGLSAELDAIVNADAEDTDDHGDTVDAEKLANELEQLAQLEASKPGFNANIVEDEENVSAELQAKVDKIMEDPRLMEKLIHIQQLIAERQKSDLSTIPHETAPDPYELDDTRTATLKERMHIAKADPEHAAALARLHVKLRPPFNIAPALKSFNQAIEFAYIGANDDIRRILWRTYLKARTLPTFLQNLSEDAWDIIYYSQAVTWGSNQNRHSHLKILLADLKSLGRDGPPTHPSTLMKQDD